ncbi:AfsR/SARP family transcriptional regulator [Streptomyces daliensis]|uniref:Tetratricopeptide repeat protein n=1 Tax=Streptomyces daliensis TaxID=299421 RepID=A0A8T4J282_9ACTN|nr:tetratricopeptide repeat protein [Streptomyces daliensis]
MVELLALGPLELWHEGRQYELGSVKERRVLAVLLHARGEPVSVDALMARVWDDEMPRTAVETLHSYLSRLRGHLRQAVGGLAWVEHPSSRLYQLRVDNPDDVDLLRFQRLRNDAQSAAGRGDRELAVGLLTTAEALWRGQPFAEFTGGWADSARARLNEDHLRVREARIRLELEMGRHADLIGELHELAAENPLAQQITAALMLALYRSGRHVEALALYQNTYRRLRRELGIEPGPELREMHCRILEQDPVLLGSGQGDGAPGTVTGTPVATAEEGRTEPAPAPSTLPRDTRHFTGRLDELATLLAESDAAQGGDIADLDGADGADGTPVPPASRGPDPAGTVAPAATVGPAGSAAPAATVDSARTVAPAATVTPARTAAPVGNATALPLTVVHGMPGVGKTALALRAAHRLSARYPDGQFYVDLRGYSPQPRYEPAEALAALLRAAGAGQSGDELPDSLDELTSRWREWTARRRVLLILDNARDAEQVTPLLPGAAACRAIVTSRNRLAGLDGASWLYLDVLSASEAATLFTRVAGASRASDTVALRRLVEACGCHPLALQLLAGRFRHRESWDLQHLVDLLDQAPDTLDEFDDGVASAFQLSYAGLDTSTRRLFRRLALHPGPDLTLDGAAALAGADTARTRREVEELLDRHLLEEPVRGRYRLHDLARAFGRRACRGDEPAEGCRDALQRLLSLFLTAADRADRLAHPQRRRLPVGAERESAYVTGFADRDEALVWLAVERANLLAVARTAAAQAPAYAALFPHVLAQVLKLWGAWDVAAELHGAAVAALRESGDRRALAQTLVERADVLAQGHHEEALRCAREALALFDALGDPRGRADALLQTGRARLAAGQGTAALRDLDQALALYRDIGARHGEAETLNVRGVALHYGGDYEAAVECFLAMLAICEALQDPHGQAQALNNLGEIQWLEGHYERAREYYERSLTLVRDFGGRQELAILDTNLGGVHRATGDTERALACFHRALASYRASCDTSGEADTLISLGTAYADMNRKGEALLHFNMAEEVARRTGNAYERQRALIGVGGVQRESGRFTTAMEIYEEARRVASEIGFPLGSAHALAGLARTSLSAHSIEEARSYGEQALTLYRDLGAEAEAGALTGLMRGLGETGS